MLKQNQEKLQLDSLRKTTTTKQYVLDAIASASTEELRGLAPDNHLSKSKEDILQQADALLSNTNGVDLADFETESIVLGVGRPVFFVQDSLPLMTGPEVKKFKDLIDNATSNLNLKSKISAVGRIETDNLPGFDWLGTGWLFEEDLLITNRHVAAEFIEMAERSFDFRHFMGSKVKSRIDFLAEYNRNEALEFTIEQCLYMAPEKAHDIAIFRIRSTDSSSHLPISILNGDPRVREDIAVIGYPAFDSRASKVAEMERIYQGVFDVKRFAPGKITGVHTNEGIALHDASTLGGNSGSIVLSLETGKAVSLHFAGKEGKGNFSVMSSQLRRVINALPRRNFALGVSSTNGSQANAADLLQEMVPRNCTLAHYNPIQVPAFKISGRFISYATPDSTFAVTRRLFSIANESILIGIYDFSAEHMVVCIKEAIERGVSVSLMLDIDSAKELDVFKKLGRLGVECVPAPSCASKNVSYFSSSHEKVIVIDGEWTMIQSGNYSNNSIPFNEGDGEVLSNFKTGNRDMGIAIESKPLAKFFTGLLRADMQLEKNAAGEESMMSATASGDFLIEAPAKRPSQLFPSMEFNLRQKVKVQPVLSPDNYMSEIPDFLRSAKQSIKIEQQYIRVGQKHINFLLEAIADAKQNGNEDFSVQIIVAPPIGDDKGKTDREVNALRDMGFEVALLSKKHFVHCHNKLIIVDDSAVLISSQNWSDSAVSKNREAGIIIYEKEIAEYYSRIFDADWTVSEDNIEEVRSANVFENLEAFSSGKGKYVIVDACDVQEV